MAFAVIESAGRAGAGCSRLVRRLACPCTLSHLGNSRHRDVVDEISHDASLLENRCRHGLFVGAENSRLERRERSAHKI
jgi:hypothetical protein